MQEPSLFDEPDPPQEPPKREPHPAAVQADEIKRVRERIAAHVVTFWKHQLFVRGMDGVRPYANGLLPGQFFIEELRKQIVDRKDIKAAPASPDRILRDLRQRKVINYRVVSRSRSLYEALPL